MGAMWGIMIQTTVLVTAILAVRKLLGEKLHAYIRYGLWLLVALRLLIPVNFVDSPVSVLRLADIVAGKYAETSSVKGEQNSYLGSIGSSPMKLQEKSPLQENEGAAGRSQAAGEKAAADRQQTEIENTAADRQQTDGESTVTDRSQAAGENVVTDGLQTDGKSAVAGEENIVVEDAHRTAVDSVTQRKSISAAVIFQWIWITGQVKLINRYFKQHHQALLKFIKNCLIFRKTFLLNSILLLLHLRPTLTVISLPHSHSPATVHTGSVSCLAYNLLLQYLRLPSLSFS